MGAARDRRARSGGQRRDGDGRTRHRLHHRIARHRGHSARILARLPQPDGLVMEACGNQTPDRRSAHPLRPRDRRRALGGVAGLVHRILLVQNRHPREFRPGVAAERHGMPQPRNVEDRVTGLRTINVYEPHRYLHQISGLEVESVNGNVARCRSNYLVVRTMLDGAMSIFSAGVYLDKVLLDPGKRDLRSGWWSRIRGVLRHCWYFRYSLHAVKNHRIITANEGTDLSQPEAEDLSLGSLTVGSRMADSIIGRVSADRSCGGRRAGFPSLATSTR